jgi:hypothetical protein
MHDSVRQPPFSKSSLRHTVTILGVAVSVAFALFAARADEAAKPSDSPLTPESRAVYQQRVLPFLKKHCWQCHDEDSAKAGFRVDNLGTDFLVGKTADRWREAIDQINLGKMPKKKAKPEPHEAFAVVEWVNQELRNAEKRAQSTGGRTPMRRLNRTEYANTVRDLFHLDENFVRKIEQELPTDGKVDGFDRGGAALFVDKSQLQAYLDMAEMVVREALPAAPTKANTYRIRAADDGWLLRRSPKKTTTMEEVLNRGDVKFADLLAKEKRPLPEVERGPEPNDLTIPRDGGVEIYAAALVHLGYTLEGNMLRKVVTRDGWYRFRVHAGASRGSGKFAVDAVRIQAEYCRQSRELRRSFTWTIDAPLDRPQVYETTVFLHRGGEGFQPDLRFTWNMYHGGWRGFHDDENAMLLTNPELRRLYWAGRQSGEAYSRTLETKQPPEVVAAARKKRDEAHENLYRFALTFRGPVNHLNPNIDPQAVPHLWYEYIEVEGPLTEWPTKASQEIFFQGTEQDGADYARRIFARFLPRAYRRPVKPEEVEALVQLVQTMQDKHGKTFADAVRAAVASVLVSSHFLYLQEPENADAKPRELSNEELANRLSYFLWCTMPDAELFDLAARKRLRAPGVLRAQVQRMLADPKARQFVESFVGQWMRVREFDSVMVDTRQYKDYDDALRDAAIREPYEFFHELLRANSSLLNILDSDFLVINERLAKHYGIDGVKGDGFRRVPLRPEHRRGGIVGMAGLLTFLADGTRTLPVRRGAYLLDVLWNTPASLPPPNAGDLPMVKGKNLTVRQRLEQHRSVAFCASCHTKIDPLGLALENYDAIGAWRERQNGEGRKGGKYDPPIDPSGVMPSGQTFKTLPEFKRLLLDEKEKFLKGFTEKLLAYALGRPVGAADRTLVSAILGEAAKDGYRFQAVLQAIVATQAFQSK